MFPRHVLEHVVRGPPKDPDHVSGLATFHECTTIMFMDIVGFTSMSKEVQPDQVSEMRGCATYTQLMSGFVYRLLVPSSAAP